MGWVRVTGLTLLTGSLALVWAVLPGLGSRPAAMESGPEHARILHSYIPRAPNPPAPKRPRPRRPASLQPAYLILTDAAISARLQREINELNRTRAAAGMVELDAAVVVLDGPDAYERGHRLVSETNTLAGMLGLPPLEVIDARAAP